MVPLSVLNDLRLSGDAVRAFGILLDCSRDQRSKIGFARLGERLGVSRSTARRVIRELANAGHVTNRETINGHCPSYELTRVPELEPVGRTTDATPTGIKHGTGPRTTGANVNTDPYHRRNATGTGDGTLSRRQSLNSVLETDPSEKTTDGERHHLSTLTDDEAHRRFREHGKQRGWLRSSEGVEATA
jgi:hypothetical protein